MRWRIVFPFSALIGIITVWFVSFFSSQSLAPEGLVTIYVATNEIHADVILPRKTLMMNWDDFLSPTSFGASAQNAEWVEFGWGDRRFYLEMPTWDQFTLELAFDALFLPSNAIMHVSYLPFHPTNYLNVFQIKLNPQQYFKLINYIKSSFDLKNAAPQLIQGKGYGDYDNFYEGVGHYSMLRTCNMWTRDALNEAEQPVPLWNPTKYGIEWVLRKSRVLFKVK